MNYNISISLITCIGVKWTTTWGESSSLAPFAAWNFASSELLTKLSKYASLGHSTTRKTGPGSSGDRTSFASTTFPFGKVTSFPAFSWPYSGPGWTPNSTHFSARSVPCFGWIRQMYEMADLLDLWFDMSTLVLFGAGASPNQRNENE